MVIRCQKSDSRPEMKNAPAQSPIVPNRRSFATTRAIMALMLREMATSYGRSPGGYIWAILEPIAGIALLSAVFSAAFRNPPLGISFPVFYATGMMPFIMFNDIQGKVASALMYSKQLLTYPTVTFVDALLARFFLNAITQLLVAYLIFTISLMTFETRVTLDLPVIFMGFALAAFLGFGIGTLNAYMFTRFQAYQRAWSIMMRPMFLISCIFFLFETIPSPYQDWLWYNPMVHLTGLMRSGFYRTYDADYVSIVYLLGVSIAALAMGLLLLRRNYQDLLSR